MFVEILANIAHPAVQHGFEGPEVLPGFGEGFGGAGLGGYDAAWHFLDVDGGH